MKLFGENEVFSDHQTNFPNFLKITIQFFGIQNLETVHFIFQKKATKTQH